MRPVLGTNARAGARHVEPDDAGREHPAEHLTGPLTIAGRV
jgi:hypothetical protein